MVTQYGIKLAVHIISSTFGDLVSKVCECLLRKGTLSLPEITRYTELSSNEVINCLLVLIKHNCIQAFSIQKDGAFGVPPKVITQYTVIFDNILHRLRFSKFIAIVSKEFDRECVGIFEGILQHGRLTLEEIILRAISDRNEGNSNVQDALRESFVRLVNAHYVERCPAPEPFLAPPDEEEEPKKRSKSAKLAAAMETVEQRALAAAVPMEAQRFAIVTNCGTDVTSGEKTGSQPINVTIGEKRNHEVLEMDRDVMASICEKEVIWRVNFEEFILRLRHKACVENVRARFDGGAATVLQAMLEATRSEEKKVKTENSVPVSIDTILKEVMKSEEGRSIATVEYVRAALGQLDCHSNTRGMEELYSVDLRNIIDIAQDDEVESTVLKRYGREAYRIFRLLSKAGRLVETDKISDTTFVEKKETLKILNNLWKDDYLHKEIISLQGSRQSQFFLWKVNKRSLWELVRDEMYHAALNLSQRMTYELEQEHEILYLPREKRVGAPGKRYERIRKVKILLESSLMNLDDALMLFHDF